MTGTRIFADIRKQRGDSRFVIELIRAFCSQKEGPRIDWLVRRDQAPLLPSESIIGTADQFDPTWGTRLAQLISEQQNASDGAFYVLSWDNAVLTGAKTASRPGQQVNILHLSGLYNTTRTRTPGYLHTSMHDRVSAQYFRPNGPSGSFVRQRPPFETGRVNVPGLPVLSLQQAIDLTKEALRLGGHVSPQSCLPQKELRPALCALDRRAVKQTGDAASEMLIPNVVDRGLQEGWLKRFRLSPGKTGTEAIYLNEDFAARVRASEGSAVEGTPVNMRSMPSESPESQTAAVAANPTSSSPQVTDGPTTVSKPKRHPNRATNYEEILTKSRIGGLPETRDRLFTAVEQVLSENHEGLPFLELFSKAGERARNDAQAEGYLAEVNWPVALLCVKRLMLWAEVLEGPDGNRISDKIGSIAKRVLKLEPDFRLICEAFLIEHIIEKTGGINYDDDTYYIGLTLYRKGKERAIPGDDLKARVDSVLQYLEENNRVSMDPENRMVRARGRNTRSLRVAAG
jgi:hypothetical protein